MPRLDTNRACFPPSHEAPYRLSMFIALQVARGWGFRRDLEAITNLTAPDFVAVQATPDRVRATTRRSGMPHGDTEVAQMIARLTGPDGPRAVLRQGHYVQYMLQFAIEAVMPSLWSRIWRLLDFGEPVLLTSDEPVAILQPEADPPDQATRLLSGFRSIGSERSPSLRAAKNKWSNRVSHEHGRSIRSLHPKPSAGSFITRMTHTYST